MHRRSVLALGISVIAAGCSDIQASLGMGGALVDESFSGNRQFSADEGDVLEITVTVEEIDGVEADQGGDDVDQRSISFAISHDESGHLLAESIEDEATFEREVGASGTHNVVVSGGTAHVTIETV